MSEHEPMPPIDPAEPATTGEPTTEATAAASDEAIPSRVLELEQQVRDVQLRAQAEIQNIQRRAERDVAQAHKFALEKFASQLLEVVDNLERALVATPSSADETLHQGVSLTLKQLLDALKRQAVEPIDPLGEPFNAELHQAVSMQPSTTAEPNTVTAVLQKGYTLSGRLLRPAMVMVATAP